MAEQKKLNKVKLPKDVKKDSADLNRWDRSGAGVTAPTKRYKDVKKGK